MSKGRGNIKKLLDSYGDCREPIEEIIEKHGYVTPQLMVEAAKDRKNPLHRYFEWDDRQAAQRFRVHQARMILSHVMIEIRPGLETRAFVNVRVDDSDPDAPTSRWQPVEEVMKQPKLKAQLLATALEELESFRHRYQTLRQLADVHRVIGKVLARVKA